MRRTQKQASHKPAFPKQLAANRANAANSTGPKSPEGKARSARNSVKHGFTASTFAVVRLEDFQEIALLKSDLASVYQPVNSQELLALERMALAQQAILHAARLESGLFTTCLNETLDNNDRPFTPMSQELAGDGDIEITRAQNRNYLLAEGFLRIIRQSNGWTVFLRYQAQAERRYRCALLDELEFTLISADIGVRTTGEILTRIRSRVERHQVNGAAEPKGPIRTHLLEVLEAGERAPARVAEPPAVILVVGVNGSGKTTTVSKLAQRFRTEGRPVPLCAAGAFRAAAIERLEIWAERTGSPPIRQNAGSGPSAVFFPAVNAGRAPTKENRPVCNRPTPPGDNLSKPA
jgi:flagellar biosynthesis GTPase FlhF